MIIYEYTVKIFQVSIAVIAFDIEDVAKNYPGAEIITRTGSHFFIGDGSEVAQSLTKATPVASAFTGSSGSSTGTSHDEIPVTADITIAKPASVAFTGPSSGSSFMWEMDGHTTLYGQSASVSFETAGTFVMKLTVASDGGQSDPNYMKITVT